MPKNGITELMERNRILQEQNAKLLAACKAMQEKFERLEPPGDKVLKQWTDAIEESECNS